MPSHFVAGGLIDNIYSIVTPSKSLYDERKFCNLLKSTSEQKKVARSQQSPFQEEATQRNVLISISNSKILLHPTFWFAYHVHCTSCFLKPFFIFIARHADSPALRLLLIILFIWNRTCTSRHLPYFCRRNSCHINTLLNLLYHRS